MRIAQITYGIIRIPAGMHGAIEGHTLMISRRLAELGNSVTIIDRRYSSADPNYEFIDGLRIARLSMRRKLQSSKSNLMYKIHLIQQRIEFAIQARRFLKVCRRQFDVVNAYDVFAVLSLLLRNKPQKEKVNVFYTHDSSAWPTESKSKINRLAMMFLGVFLRRTSGVIVRNANVKHLFVKYSNLSKDSVFVIPPAIDMGSLSVSDLVDVRAKYGLQDKLLVLFVGRISAEKGIKTLIEAAEIVVLKKGIKNVKFVIVGPDVEFDPNAKSESFSSTVRFMIKEERLQDYVLFTGFLPLSELKSFFATCNAFVLPSVVETFGQVISEAMFYGKPIIATRTPGAMMQIHDGWNGYLIEIGNEHELAEKIAFVLSNPEESSKIGMNAKNYVANFDSIILVHNYLDLYEKLKENVPLASSVKK